MDARGIAGVADYVGQHPRIVPVAICTVLLIMLIASVIRALKRWEILPDPILPEKLRNVWYAAQKAVSDAFLRSLTGKKNND